MDRTLNSKDSTDIARRLVGLENKAQNLGRVLELPKYIIDITPPPSPAAILYIIGELLKQVEPRPTWRVILAALRDPLVGEAGLAREIETSLMEGSAVSTLPVAQPELTTAAHQSAPSSADYTSHQGTGISISLTLSCIFSQYVAMLIAELCKNTSR